MDHRLLVTASFVAHVVAGLVFAGAYLAADVTFAEGQGAFIGGVGYGGRLLALVLIWFRNYVFGAALFVVSLVATLVGSWLWYNESHGFRTVLHGLVGKRTTGRLVPPSRRISRLPLRSRSPIGR